MILKKNQTVIDSLKRKYQILTLTLSLIVLIIFSYFFFKPKQFIFLPQEYFLSQPTLIKFEYDQLRYQAKYYLNQNQEESRTYQSPFTINDTTLVTAKLTNKKNQNTQTFYHPYFVNETTNFPIVSLIIDQKDLWNKEKGIYVIGSDPDEPNYSQNGSDWERKAIFQYFEDRKIQLNTEIQTEIHGGGSRTSPKKSFRIAVNNEDEVLHYPFFGSDKLNRHKTLNLRNGGNDWRYTGFRDAMFQDIISQDSRIDSQASQPVTVFLNGQYWGIYNLRQRYDEYYFAYKYQVSPKKIAIVEIPHDMSDDRGQGELKHGDKSDLKDYNDLYQLANSKYVDNNKLKYIENKMDLENFMEVCVTQIYGGNIDWPFGNVILWKHKTEFYQPEARYGLDGRWRWALIDLDHTFAYTADGFSTESIDSSIMHKFIDNKFPFILLFKNSDFEVRFKNKAADMLNTKLSSDNVISVIDQYQTLYAPEIERSISRWKYHQDKDNEVYALQSKEEWLAHIEHLREFARQRPDIVREQIMEWLGIQNDYQLSVFFLDQNNKTLTDQAGIVTINSVDIPIKDRKWQGRYFEKQPITLTVKPNSNYRFVKWQPADSRLEANEEHQHQLNMTSDQAINLILEKK